MRITKGHCTVGGSITNVKNRIEGGPLVLNIGLAF